MVALQFSCTALSAMRRDQAPQEIKGESVQKNTYIHQQRLFGAASFYSPCGCINKTALCAQRCLWSFYCYYITVRGAAALAPIKPSRLKLTTPGPGAHHKITQSKNLLSTSAAPDLAKLNIYMESSYLDALRYFVIAHIGEVQLASSLSVKNIILPSAPVKQVEYARSAIKNSIHFISLRQVNIFLVE